MKETIKVGVVGIGKRGLGTIEQVMVPQKGVIVAAVCDVYPDRTKAGADLVEKLTGTRPFETTDASELIALPELDAVVITAAWEAHIPLAIEAMEHGKYAAMEVAGAYTLDQCYELVKTYERTGMPCMFLENCCYGRYELMIQNMVRQGVFGRIVYCEGGYCHDLRDEITTGEEMRHYRLRNYQNRNLENYPSHELGPIAQLLDINHGNRMVSLTSVASGSYGLHEYVLKTKGENDKLASVNWAQADVIDTVIKCSRGETIHIQLDTSLPRPYSRRFTVRGTKGMYMEDNNSIFLDDTEESADHFNWKPHWDNAEAYFEKYEHPIWKEYLAQGVQGGHDGMNWLVYGDFFRAVQNETEVPIDVYDAAAWMAVSVLSEQSILMGGAPVAIPDFTGGKFTMR